MSNMILKLVVNFLLNEQQISTYKEDIYEFNWEWSFVSRLYLFDFYLANKTCCYIWDVSCYKGFKNIYKEKLIILI